jgi:hypothetical protein
MAGKFWLALSYRALIFTGRNNLYPICISAYSLEEYRIKGMSHKTPSIIPVDKVLIILNISKVDKNFCHFTKF